MQECAIRRNRVCLLECGINNLRLKKSMGIKKAFVSELESIARRNHKLRGVVKQSYRVVRAGNLFWSFGTIKSYVNTLGN